MTQTANTVDFYREDLTAFSFFDRHFGLGRTRTEVRRSKALDQLGLILAAASERKQVTQEQAVRIRALAHLVWNMISAERLEADGLRTAARDLSGAEIFEELCRAYRRHAAEETRPRTVNELTYRLRELAKASPEGVSLA